METEGSKPASCHWAWQVSGFDSKCHGHRWTRAKPMRGTVSFGLRACVLSYPERKGFAMQAAGTSRGLVMGRVQEGRGAGESVGGCGLHLEANLIVLAAGLAAWGSRKGESVMTLLSWASNSQVVPVTEMGQPGGEAIV